MVFELAICKAEAKEQLEKVLELNTKHPQARAMLFTMEQAAAIVAQRQRDPEVRQTGAETMSDRPPERPRLRRDSSEPSADSISPGMPVIFDLPTPLAIKRTNEFCQLRQPVLQAYCVKCHDGNYDGEFQLVPIKSRADQTAETRVGPTSTRPCG